MKSIFVVLLGIIFFIGIAIVLSSLMGLNRNASAKIEWEVLEKITLDDAPNDIAISGDGTIVYILSSNNILIYSTI